MLSTGFKKDDIISLRLVSGEEVMAKLVEENMTSYKVMKPASLAIARDQQGGMHVEFHPSMFSMNVDNSIEIMKTSVAFATKPREDMKNGYVQSTTKIQMATANDISTIEAKK